MILLDTCALLWWTLDPVRLSKAARERCEDAEKSGGAVCSISFWEIAVKVRRGSLEIGIPVEEYVSRIKSLGSIEILPVDERIWLKSAALDWPHRDPVDRVIVSAAEVLRAEIVTSDQAIRAYYRRCVW